MQYFNTMIQCNDSYAGSNQHDLILSVLFTTKIYEGTLATLQGNIYIEYSINNISQPTIQSEYINRSVEANSSITFPFLLTQIMCNGHYDTTSNTVVTAEVYFSGKIIGEEIIQCNYEKIGSIYEEKIVLISHGTSTSDLEFYATIDGLLLSVGCNTSFPGTVNGNMVVSIMDGRDQSTRLLEDRVYAINNDTQYIVLPNNFTTPTLYITITGQAQVSDDYIDYVERSGSWSGFLPYPIQGIKVYTKESNYNKFGILYVKNGTNGYSIAREFNVLK